MFIPGKILNEEENFLRIAAKKLKEEIRLGRKWNLENLLLVSFVTMKKKKYDEPLIQLKAKKIIHDKKNLNVKYYDAFFDFKGRSILSSLLLTSFAFS